MWQRVSGLGVLLLWGISLASASEALEFSLHKLTGDEPGPTILVIGGIQGDEPGGFTAASLLVTDYRIRRGNLWVVPNLNFPSIIRRSRGVHGDLNRKFSRLRRNDPEYRTVARIKEIIAAPEVDAIINLHDGSGFYRSRHIDALHNPYRWGQSIIIDQERVGSGPFADLGAIAKRVTGRVNPRILNADHRFEVKNTHTRDGDKEMEKTLTYFAVRHHKPAFAIEASKEFRTARRVLHHLQVLEGFFQEMGIDYQRDFGLEHETVLSLIGSDLQLGLYDNRIFLDLSKARRWLNYIPMKRGAPLQFRANNPLMAVVNGGQYYRVRYGNRGVTHLRPQFFDYDDSLKQVQLRVDGKPRQVAVGSRVRVHEQFAIDSHPGYRVNVIGFSPHPGQRKDESGHQVGLAKLMQRFSIDRKGRIYRAEFYRGRRFSGMILLEFVDQPMALRSAEQSSAEEG